MNRNGDTSSTRTRRGGRCLRFDDKTFFIYRTCVRRAVRPCFVRTCCAVASRERDRCATTLARNIKRTFSSHFTLHSSHHALHASHLHFTLHSSSHLKSSDFLAPHVTSSDLFSFHPIPSHMSSTQVLLNCFSSHPSTEKKFISTHLSSSARQKALTVRVKPFAQETSSAQSFCTQKLET